MIKKRGDTKRRRIEICVTHRSTACLLDLICYSLLNTGTVESDEEASERRGTPYVASKSNANQRQREKG